jgi:hypothetical protein
MSYYPTLAEDIACAKEIVARGKTEIDTLADKFTNEEIQQAIKQVIGGTIVGADTYAAYKILESFIEVIETIGVDVCKVAMRARALSDRS